MKRLRRGLVAVAILALVLQAVPGIAAAPGGARPLVCIDPGHGGEDQGAVANGLEEKELNLDMAFRAKPIIESMGYRVIMTRESDVYVSLEERCRIANSAGATIFVSIHNNAYVSTANGTETFCFYDSEAGRRLATAIHQQVTRRINTNDRGVKEAGFYVLKHTDMPAALLEGAFLTNEQDAQLLADPGFRQKIAEGVAAGVDSYLVDPGLFNEYILLMNPDPEEEAEVEIAYMECNGEEECFIEEVPPESRLTLYVDEYVYNTDVSARVRSTNGVPVVAERSMYFDFELGRGGHAAPAALQPSTHWYLAEGSTAWGFSTFILVQNPGDEENWVVMEFMRSDGIHKRFKYYLAPHSRFTLDASSVEAFSRADFSVEIESEEPVVVERSMYFECYYGIPGGHVSPGVTEASRTWYLPEGYTGPGFDTFVLLANANETEAVAHMTYLLPGGETLEEYLALEPNSRRTVHLDENQELADTDVSVKVEASVPLVVERSMYFDYKGVREGSNSVAAPNPSRSWYLAEGYTGGGFDTYLLLMNPNGAETGVILEFMLAEGESVKKGITLPPDSRTTVWLNQEKGIENAEVSTYVASQCPIVVERAMYFRSGDRIGGHTAMGSISPAEDWYFAEGCTR